MEAKIYSPITCTQGGFRLLLVANYRSTARSRRVKGLQVYKGSRGGLVSAVNSIKLEVKFCCKASSIEKFMEGASIAPRDDKAASLGVLGEFRVVLKMAVR